MDFTLNYQKLKAKKNLENKKNVKPPSYELFAPATLLPSTTGAAGVSGPKSGRCTEAKEGETVIRHGRDFGFG